MKNSSIIVLVWLIPLLLLKQNHVAAQDIVIVGVPIFTPISDPVIDKPSIGVEASLLYNKKDFYFIGMNIDVGYSSSGKRSVTMDLIVTDETISSELIFLGAYLVNRFDITPQSKLKLFIDANAGLKLAAFKTLHQGKLLNDPVEREVYMKISPELSGELSLNFYIPFKKESHKGLQLKTGLVFSSGVTYIDDKSVYIENSTYKHSGERTSSTTYWVSSIGFLLYK
jgi:hypothetical protein